MQPQLPSLAQKSEQQSPSTIQGLSSGTHEIVVHEPAMHSSPPQLMPQPPQFSGSSFKFAHLSPQSTRPPLQVAVTVTLHAVDDAATMRPAPSTSPMTIFFAGEVDEVCM